MVLSGIRGVRSTKVSQTCFSFVRSLFLTVFYCPYLPTVHFFITFGGEFFFACKENEVVQRVPGTSCPSFLQGPIPVGNTDKMNAIWKGH